MDLCSYLKQLINKSEFVWLFEGSKRQSVFWHRGVWVISHLFFLSSLIHVRSFKALMPFVQIYQVERHRNKRGTVKWEGVIKLLHGGELEEE